MCLDMSYTCELQSQMVIQHTRGRISLLLPRLLKLPGPFEKHWLGKVGNLGSSKEIQPKFVVRYNVPRALIQYYVLPVFKKTGI